MMSVKDWLIDLSENFSVQHFNDIESGICVAKVKEDVYLMKHAEVKKS